MRAGGRTVATLIDQAGLGVTEAAALLGQHPHTTSRYYFGKRGDHQPGRVGAVSNIIEGKKQWRSHMARVRALPPAHRLSTREAVDAWVGDAALERRTPRTVGTIAELHRELELIRDRGYALDEEENEPGVGCLALPVYALSPATPSGALSVSALTYRTPLPTLVDAVDEVRAVLGPLGEAGA